MKTTTPVTWIVAVLSIGPACSSTTAGSRCVPNEVVACPCAGGPRGTQTCNAAGSYDACICPVIDAGATDVGLGDAIAIDAPDVPLPVTPDASAADAADAVASDMVDVPDPADAGCGDATACGGACTDLRTDPRNCGRCGHDCTQLLGVAGDRVTCVAGVCDTRGACLPGRAHCTSRPDDGCETSLDSAANCGACGVTCREPTPFCASGDGGVGSCVSGCGAAARCGMSCVDTATSATHCGVCDRRCPDVANGTATCVAGACTPRCNAGFADCDGDAANGCEVDLRISADHCGSCRSACAGGRACVAGSCGCPSGQSNCGGACVVTGERCTVGVGACARTGVTVCAAAGAGTMCSATRGEPAPETCDNVDNDCDEMVDEDLVRSCYSGPGSTAGVGACRAGMQGCAAGSWGRCVGEVVPTAEACDNVDNNCNGTRDEGLTRACYSGPAGTSAVGECRAGVESCAAGAWGSCSGQVTPVAETCNGRDDDCDGQSDEAPATSMCPSGVNASPRCAMGACGLACTPGYSDCDRASSNGCETDLSSDPLNCGACGFACRAGQTCAGGACAGCGAPTTVENAIETAIDGGRSSVGPGVDLHTTVYLRGYGGVFERDGRIWFAEGTTSCGGWGTRVTSFSPQPDGTPGSVLSRCESVTGASVGVSMASGGALGLCYQTHAPEYAVRCGRLGATPGTYADVTGLGTLAGLLLGAGPDGFAGGLVTSVTTAQTLSLQTFDLAMNPLRTTQVANRAQPLAVARIGSQWWLARQPPEARSEISIDRVGDNGTVAATIRVPPMGAAATTTAPSLSAVATPDGLSFLVAIGAELYLGAARLDGSVGARRFFADTSAVNALLVGRGTGWLAVLRRTAAGAEGVWMLRLDCRGAVAEPPVRIAVGANLSPWGATLDAAGRALWVVLVRNDGGENFTLSTRRVALP